MATNTKAKAVTKKVTATKKKEPVKQVEVELTTPTKVEKEYTGFIGLVKKYPIDISLIGFIFTTFLFAVIYSTGFEHTLNDLKNINTTFSIDIFYSSSTISGVFLHVGLLGLISYLIAKAIRINMNGATFMGVLMAFTFGFLSKSLLVIPFVFLADIILSRYRKRKMSSYYLSTIFSLSLSPVFTYIWTQQGYDIGSFFLAGFVMMIISALMSQISTLTSRVHEGYTIANGAAAAGFIAVAVNGLLKAFFAGYKDSFGAVDNSWGDTYKGPIILLIGSFSLIFLLVAIIKNDRKGSFIQFQLKDGSKLPVDYVSKYGFTNAIINLLIITWAAVIASVILKVEFNAYVVAALFQIMSFGVFGKTFRNISLVTVGVMVGWMIFPHENYSYDIAWAIALYATLLAPTASLGLIFPFLAGMLHIAIIPIITSAHGSLLLYNNGMTSLFVSVTLLGVYKSFSWSTIRKTEENATANTSEKLKTVNVGNELLFYMINNDIGKPSLQYIFEEKASKIKIVIKDGKMAEFKAMADILNKTERDISYESEFWTLLGKDPKITNINLLGKMIDIASQEKVKDGYIITITRHI